MNEPKLTDSDLVFIAAHPVARLATVDALGVPHVLPVCFVIFGDTLYVTIDQKPKTGNALQLKRLRNIVENPKAAVIVDRYSEDWSQLGWIMLRGSAEILECGTEHDDAQNALKARYFQYRDMALAELPVIALRIERVSKWGDLAVR